MNDSFKPLTGRQLLSTLRASERAIVVVDPRSQKIVFANQTAADAFSVQLDVLTGYSLNNDPTSQPSDDDFMLVVDASLKSIAATINGHCDLLPPPSAAASTIGAWLAVPLVLEKSEPLTIYFAVDGSERLPRQLARSADWSADQATREFLSQMKARDFALNQLPSIQGPSSATRLARSQVQLAIDRPVAVCLIGPKGTGKKKLAQAILYHRTRKQTIDATPTIIQCGLVDRSLLVELLDLITERSGAPTAGQTIRPLVILESLERLPVDCITPLLRFVEKFGSENIVTTAVDSLDDQHREVSDWMPLVNRLRVVTIALAPLTQRLDDLHVLTSQFIGDEPVPSSGLGVTELSEQATAALRAYCWPGNIDELQACIASAARRTTVGIIELEHLPLAVRTFASTATESKQVQPLDLDATLLDIERHILQQAIDHFPRNRAAAARHLGISRTRLLRRLEQLGMSGSGNLADDESPETLKPDAVQNESHINHDEPIFRELDPHEDV